MKELTLNNTQTKVILDANDYYAVRELEWTVTPNGTAIQAWNKFTKKHTALTNFLMGKPPKGFIWDHIDRNIFNNQRNNFRLVTRQQNAQNRSQNKKKGKCHSKYKGVSFHIRQNKWRACIRINLKQIWLGVFNIEEAAARAYNKAALQYHGDSATLNQLEGVNEQFHQYLPPSHD